MKKIFMILAGIGICYSAYAADPEENSVGNAPYNHSYPENKVGNTGNVLYPGLSTNPNRKPHFAPTPNTSLGNGGNTGAIGTDNGGGNGPVH